MAAQRRAALACVLALALGACLTGAQPTESYKAQNTFTTAGTIYNRTGTRQPLSYDVYQVPVPPSAGNPDVLVTLNATTGDTGLHLYCNPGYGLFVDPAVGRLPGPGFNVWSSELSTPVNQVFISRNDPYYSQTGGRSSGANNTAPFFVCSVYNSDPAATTNYTFVVGIISDNRTLAQPEQAALASLYGRCCGAAGACNAWKAQNRGFVSANGGAVNTDFCSFPNQICDPSGRLYRLNLDAFNLSCAWPGDLLAQFSQLATLSLAANPNLQGNTTAAFATVANLTYLHFLDLSGDTGLGGTIDSGSAGNDLCAAAQGNLISLTLNSMGLTGTVPACLYSQGSSLITLDLGSNNFTGQLRNTIPANSSLQLLHLDLNQLTGPLPASLANANVLVDLDLTQNGLTGTIPPALGAIRTLKSFIVMENSLSGPIPDTFGTAPNLQSFDAKLNRLTRLPAAWTNASYNASLSSLVQVRASFNNISGPFPTGLIRVPQLTSLILNVNNLTGPLPTNASMFPSLRALNVSYNQLTGTIPAQFNQSAIFSAAPVYLSNGAIQLQVFDVSYNRLNGSLPAFFNASSVPLWTRPGVFLGGNNLSADCSNPGLSYLTSVCPANASAALPPAAGAGVGTAAPPPPAARTVSPTTPTPSPTAAAGVRTTGAPAPPPSVSASTTTASGAGSSPASQGGSGLSGGAIAGIVIGVAAALALVALVAALLVRRRRRDPPMPGAGGSRSFPMPGFSEGEFGRKSSLTKSLQSARSSGFERFHDEQNAVELSPAAK